MVQKEIEFDSKKILCTAEAMEWVHGLRVSIKLSIVGEVIAILEVLCPHNDKNFPELSRLSENELEQGVLKRFLTKNLFVDSTRLFEWREELKSFGYNDVSPLFTRF
jgi:hypothetical protein